MQWLENDKPVHFEFEFSDQWIILPVFIFDLDPEISTGVYASLWIVKEQSLIEIWVLSVFN